MTNELAQLLREAKTYMQRSDPEFAARLDTAAASLEAQPPARVVEESMNAKVGVELCSCGHPCCQKYWLTGLGDFVQGSGFTKEDVETIAALWNTQHDRPPTSSAAQTECQCCGYPGHDLPKYRKMLRDAAPTSAVPPQINPEDSNNSQSYVMGWNACRDAMLAAAPQQGGGEDE